MAHARRAPLASFRRKTGRQTRACRTVLFRATKGTSCRPSRQEHKTAHAPAARVARCSRLMAQRTSARQATDCDRGQQFMANPGSHLGVCSACPSGRYQGRDNATIGCVPHSVVSCDRGFELSTTPSPRVTVCVRPALRAGSSRGMVRPTLATRTLSRRATVATSSRVRRLRAQMASARHCPASTSHRRYDKCVRISHCHKMWRRAPARGGALGVAIGACERCAIGRYQPLDDTTGLCSGHTITSCSPGFGLTAAPTSSQDGACAMSRGQVPGGS